MAQSEDVIQQARALGEALAKHPRVVGFLDARARLQKDQDAQRLLVDYQRQAQRIQQLQQAGKPIEVADKHKLSELEGQMSSNDVLKEMMRRQADYIELMNRVHQALEEPITSSRQGDGAEAT